MIRKHKIMVVGAHADDVEILAGGTLWKYHEQGHEVVYVMSTDNMSGSVNTLQPDGTVTSTHEPPELMSARRKRECADAAALLGTTPIHLDHPQRHYRDATGVQHELRYGCARPATVPPDVPTILTAYEDEASVARLTDLILGHDPVCLITHDLAVTSIEHLATVLLVVASFWRAVDQGFRGAMLQGREDDLVFGDLNARWDTFVDITDCLDQKMKLIGCHACQMPTAHYPNHGHRQRPLKWGAACGCRAAEVFTWVRRADRPHLDETDEHFSPLIAELTRNSRP
jgi:LmbE family N-acetylglucosaminyl deacetylase